jgi:hypothetical protein
MKHTAIKIQFTKSFNTCFEVLSDGLLIEQIKLHCTTDYYVVLNPSKLFIYMTKNTQAIVAQKAQSYRFQSHILLNQDQDFFTTKDKT